MASWRNGLRSNFGFFAAFTLNTVGKPQDRELAHHAANKDISRVEKFKPCRCEFLGIQFETAALDATFWRYSDMVEYAVTVCNRFPVWYLS